MMNPTDVLQSALDQISREGGWTSRAYENYAGARCMLGAISYTENGKAAYHSLSRNSEAWRYVMKATKRLYPLQWQLRLMFSAKPINVFPERMIIRLTGGRWRAERIMRKALKMAKKDARIEAEKARIEAEARVTEDAEQIVRAAAEQQEHETSSLVS